MFVYRRSFVALLQFLAGTNMVIAACAGMSAAGILPYFGYPADKNLAYFIFFGTLFTYNAQRRIGDLHPIREFSKTEWTLMAFAVVGMAFGIFELPNTEIVVLAISGALSIAYAYPFIPWGGRRLSLRRLPYIKLWLIVLVWMLSCVVAPMLQARTFLLEGHPLNPVFIILQQGAFVAALTIPFDIRDIRDDFSSQRTLPQVLGVDRSRRLALLLLIVSAAAAFGLAIIGTVLRSAVAVHLVVCMVSAVVVSKATPSRHELYYFIAVDGMLLLQGLLFLLFLS